MKRKLPIEFIKTILSCQLTAITLLNVSQVLVGQTEIIKPVFIWLIFLMIVLPWLMMLFYTYNVIMLIVEVKQEGDANSGRPALPQHPKYRGAGGFWPQDLRKEPKREPETSGYPGGQQHHPQQPHPQQPQPHPQQPHPQQPPSGPGGQVPVHPYHGREHDSRALPPEDAKDLTRRVMEYHEPRRSPQVSL